MSYKKKKPEIRFKGFSEEWEEKKLSELTEYKNGKGHEDRQASSGRYELINLNSISIEGGLKHSGKFVDDADTTLNENDLVMVLSDVGHGDLLGRVAIIPDKNRFVLNQRVALLRPNKNVDPLFLFFDINAHQNYFKSQGAGMSQLNISKSSVENFTSYVPKLKEQTQIGNFFQSLDSLLSLHQRKHDKLITVKKSMLEKMFPKDGADVPEIRFQGFSGKWERQTLGKLMEISSAARVHKEEWTESGVPFFRTSDVVAAFKGFDNNKAFISFELYKELSEKSGYVQENDLLVNGGGSIGIPYLVRNNSPLYFKDGDLVWLKNSDKINSEFLYTFFTTSTFRSYLNSITHIGTISHYTIEQAKATPIKVPKKEEQIQIANFFQTLDHLISLQQRELEKLKSIKKACLEKMFV